MNIVVKARYLGSRSRSPSTQSSEAYDDQIGEMLVDE